MPACKKWSEIRGIVDGDHYLHQSQLLQEAVSRYEITPAFQQLVENIKWFNSQQETTK